MTFTQVAVTGTAASLCTLAGPYATVTLLASAASAVGTASGVTTSTGFTLPANVPVTFTLGDRGAAPITLYGVTASSASISVALST